MLTGIYCFTNNINNHSYVGQAVNIERRFRDHITRAYNGREQYSKNSLYHAIRKYGITHFTFRILELCSKEALDDREIYWIDKLDSYFHGYNQTTGGKNFKESYIKFSREKIELLKKDLQETSLTFEEIRNKYGVSIGYVSDINNGNIHFDENLSYPLRLKSKAKSKTCPICGGIKDTHSKLCMDCFKRKKHDNRIPRPERNELKNLIKTTSFVRIGKLYGVSDNTVRNWCKEMNLPYQRYKIKALTEEEWINI